MKRCQFIAEMLSANKTRVLIDQVLFSGNNFVVMLLLARGLSPFDFGVFSSFLLAGYLMISICSALVMQPFQVRIAHVNDRAGYIQFTFLLQILLGLVLTSLVAIGLQLNIMSKTSEWEISNMELVVLVVYFNAWLIHDYFRKLFLALQEINNAIWMDGVLMLMQLLGVSLMVFRGSVLLYDILWLLTLGLTLSAGLGWYMSKLRLNTKAYQTAHIKYHKKEGGYLFMSAMFQWWSSNLFVVTSGMILGVAALGAFRLVQSSFGVLNMLLQTFENYVLPNAARKASASVNGLRSYLTTVGKQGGYVFAIILIPMFIFSKHTMYLLGGALYVQYDFIVRGMVLLYAVIYVSYSVRIPIRVLGLNKSFFKGYGLTFLISAVSFKFLLENFGIKGAILGLIINQMILILYWRSTLKQNNYKL